MSTKERTLRSEQGAVFVQVGISLFVLMAFNVFVLDYGMMWIGRRQAQNAADAGALAGAIARGYDDFADPPDPGGLAAQIASQVATENRVWQQPGTAVVTFGCPSGTGRCVKVDVHRDDLPTLFGPILGITSQKVMASATSIVGNGNATDCLRPIALPDNWLELLTPGEFNFYDITGNQLPGTVDDYTPPNGAAAGTTTSISNDFGPVVPYDLDRPTTAATTPITHGLVVALDLLAAPGTFRQKLETCSGQLVQLGETLPVLSNPPAGDTALGLDTLWAQDPWPPATWNNFFRRIDNSCAPGCAPISPRFIPIALFDPKKFQLGRALSPPDWTQVGCPSALNPCITVTNIVGFFVHCVNARPCDGNATPHGHFMRYPGITSSTAPTPLLVDDASWLVTTHLVR